MWSRMIKSGFCSSTTRQFWTVIAPRQNGTKFGLASAQQKLLGKKSTCRHALRSFVAAISDAYLCLLLLSSSISLHLDPLPRPRPLPLPNPPLPRPLPRPLESPLSLRSLCFGPCCILLSLSSSELSNGFGICNSLQNSFV